MLRESLRKSPFPGHYDFYRDFWYIGINGVEIEMTGITRAKAARTAAAYFGTRRWKNTADKNGYCAYSAWDAEDREWKFQRDSSILGPDNEKCELVTPVLKGDADMELLQGLVRALRKAGGRSCPSLGTGVTWFA